jgi:hypothetical protein
VGCLYRGRKGGRAISEEPGRRRSRGGGAGERVC